MQIKNEEERIKTLLVDREFYDAYSGVISLHSRVVARGNYSESIDLCNRFIREFLNAKANDLAIELGILMVKTLKESETEPSSEAVQAIAQALEGFVGVRSKRMGTLVEKAVGWSQTADDRFGSPLLRKLAADCYLSEGDCGRAQGHLVYIGTEGDLADLVVAWKPQCYKSEEDLLVLRLTLILLCLKRIETARSFLLELDSRGVITLSGKGVEAPIQMAYFAVEAARCRNFEFMEAVRGRYKLVSRRDAATFDKLFTHIDDVIFNRQKNQGGGLFSLFSSLLSDPLTEN